MSLAGFTPILVSLLKTFLVPASNQRECLPVNTSIFYGIKTRILLNDLWVAFVDAPSLFLAGPKQGNPPDQGFASRPHSSVSVLALIPVLVLASIPVLDQAWWVLLLH